MLRAMKEAMNRGGRTCRIDAVCVLFLSVLVYYLLSGYFAHVKSSTLEFELEVSKPTVAQVFFDTGSGYSEKESQRIPVSGQGTEHISVVLPATKIKSIQIDPMEIVGTFAIKAVAVKNAEQEILLMQNNWQSHIIGKKEVTITENKDFLAGESLGDSSVELLQVPEINKVTRSWKVAIGILSCLLAAAAYFGFTLRRGSLGWIECGVLLVLGSAFLVRLSYLNQSPLPSDYRLLPTVWLDESVYFKAARYIMENGWQNYLLDPISVRSAPGVSVYIYFLYSLFETIYPIRVISIVLNCLSLLLVYRIGCLQFDKKAALLAMTACAFFSEIVKYSPTILTEPLFFFLFLAGVYVLLLALPEKRAFSWKTVLAGLLLGLAAATRSILMLYPFALLAFYVVKESYAGYRSGKMEFNYSKKILVALVVFLLVITPICVKNQVYFDRFTIATGGGTALYLGSRTDTEGDEPPYRGKHYFIPAPGPERELYSAAGTRFLNNPAEIDYLSVAGDKILADIGVQNVKHHPLDYAYWNIKKIGRLLVGNNHAWFYPQQNLADYSRQNGLTPSLIKASNITVAVLVALFGFLGMLQMAFRQRNWFLIASIAYYVGISLPFLVIQRYGLLVYILLTLFAAHAVLELYRSRNFNSLAMMLIMAGLIDLYVCSGF